MSLGRNTRGSQNKTAPFLQDPLKNVQNFNCLYFYPMSLKSYIFVSVLFSDTTVVNTLYLGLGEYVDNLVAR